MMKYSKTACTTKAVNDSTDKGKTNQIRRTLKKLVRKLLKCEKKHNVNNDQKMVQSESESNPKNPCGP